MEMAKVWKSKFVYYGLQLLIESNLSKFLVGIFRTSLSIGVLLKLKIRDWLGLFVSFESSGNARYCGFLPFVEKGKTFVRKTLNAFDALRQKWTAMDYFQMS